MKIVIAIDSFKGSLSSRAAGEAVEGAINRVSDNTEIQIFPLADGGEGTVEALAEGLRGEIIKTQVTGPLGEPVEADYGVLPDGTAVIEMAKAAGLPLVPQDKRNPLETTSYGVGELIADAIIRGCRNFIVGIGGSATNDGGIGMLSALGYRFLDETGTPVSPRGKGLASIKSINTDVVIKELADCKFQIACDVNNPLCGAEGASAVYGPQKGATPEMITKMDKWLADFAELAKTVSPNADVNYPGAGAAGGLGFAFKTFTNGELKSGAQIILEKIRIEEAIKEADLVITGEGRLDTQTVMGKGPIAIAQLAKKYGKKVIAFCGCEAPGAEICNEKGIDAFFPVLREVTTLEEALDVEYAARNLEKTAVQVFRLIKIYA